MKEIDQYAYLSKLRLIHPNQKVVFTFILLITCLVVRSTIVFLLVIVLITYLIVVRGGTPVKLFVKLLSVPLTFLIMSITTILIEFSSTPDGLTHYIIVGAFYVGVSKASIILSGIAFLKSIACVTCLYFLCLSTPITDVLIVFQKMKCSPILIEMMSLIYRFIFVLIETAYVIQTAQASRLGYKDIKTAIKSMGVLLSTLLIRALRINERLYIALQARGYNGSLYTLNDEEYKKVSYIKIILVEMILISVALGQIILI